MKKRYKALLVLIGACVIVFCVVVFMVVPRVAVITLPYRWGNIPLGQSKTIVRQYLGRPADTTAPTTDTWKAQRESGEYLLKVIYQKDTVSANYQIYFNYRLSFFHKQYLLVEKKLQQ